MIAAIFISVKVIAAAVWGTGLGYALAKRSRSGLIVLGVIVILWVVQAVDPGLLARHCPPEGCE